ncbi:MAG: DUF2177 family protein [Bdellovibrionales bacterium]|nr:DUF2177 family protein [Bdellovibrionales bacterium]
MNIKYFFISIAVIVAADFIWLGSVASDIYTQNLSEVGNIVNGKVQVVYWAAVVVYLLLGLGLALFVEPQVSSWKGALTYGAFLGCLTYGVYDFTNYATLKQYPIQLLFADWGWGTFVCGLGSTVGYIFSR